MCVDASICTCVITLHTPSLTCCACHTLATNKYILLTFACNSGRVDTVRPTARTVATNGLRSSWYFLPRRSPDMLAGPTLSIGPHYIYSLHEVRKFLLNLVSSELLALVKEFTYFDISI